MPFFSIITINLNNASGLEKTITSVLNQQFTDREFIIIDGASTDGSIQVLKKYESQLTYWVSEKDSGIYNAMNKGIDKSYGNYILFLNSGDCLYDNNVLQKIYNLRPSEQLVYGDMIIAENDGKTRKGIMPDSLNEIHLYKDTLWHPVTFIQSGVFKEFGNYNEEYRLAGDYEFFLRLILKYRCTYRHIPLVVSVFDNSGMSSNPQNRKLLMDERLKAQKKYFNILLLALFRLYSFVRK